MIVGAQQNCPCPNRIGSTARNVCYTLRCGGKTAHAPHDYPISRQRYKPRAKNCKLWGLASGGLARLARCTVLCASFRLFGREFDLCFIDPFRIRI